MWLKVWYYAQAFTKTGAFVLMIENVIRDCMPFLILSGIVLVGFSLALFALFQQSLRHCDPCNQDHVGDISNWDEINASFGTPQKAMLTLFYAMIGTFDVEVYSNSGTLTPFIIFIFVSYLSSQAIVMFNMLIAIMGDTFDKVKSTEEEQLLMGRARFIDACEAALTKREVKKLEEKIHKYLYVVLPKDENSQDVNDLWKGRVKTMETNVQKAIDNSQSNIMKVMKNERAMLGEDMRKDMRALEQSIKNDINTLEESMKGYKHAFEKSLKNVQEELEEVIKNHLTNLKEAIDHTKNKSELGNT
eukprot:g8480.t1